MHGHAVGDPVLAETAATCRAVLRKSDIFGRLGGEEFAVLLPHTGNWVQQVAEKIRAAISRQSFNVAARQFTITASCGLAVLDRSVTDLDSLLDHADAALYEAKGAGRNRCATWRSQAAVIAGACWRPAASFNGGRSTVDCTVRLLSDVGATLAVSSTAGVPETFKLQIEADGFSRLSRIAAKSDRQIEVVFA